MAKKKTTKKATKKTAKKTSKKQEVLVVGSKFKDALRSHKCNVGGDAIEGMNEMIHWYIAQAANRAKANGRKTVRKHDFVS